MHTLPATPMVFVVPKRALWLMTMLICGAVAVISTVVAALVWDPSHTVNATT